MSFSYEELAEIRHYIHQHPELSGQEYKTTAFLKERLEELYFREWIKNWSDCRNWLRPTGSGTSSRYRCPSNFGTNESALPKSESRRHAFLWS